MLTMVVAVNVLTASSHADIAASAPRQATRPIERDRQISRHARSVGSVVLAVTTRPCGAELHRDSRHRHLSRTATAGRRDLRDTQPADHDHPLTSI
jgi:hypothetical protein